MSAPVQSKRGLAVKLLTAIAVILLAIIYFQPTWWVSLTAPQYPAEAFPEGVRINFHMNGVFNGCKLLNKAEIEESEALDCVHEMDAINHFVGMYPIASGGVIEKFYSPFLFAMLGVLLIGFMIFSPRIRMAVMSVGFAGIVVWMYLAWYTPGGIRYVSTGYLSSMVTSLGQGKEEEGEEISPIIANLKESLIKSGSSMSTREELNKTLKKSGQKNLMNAIAKLHKGSEEGSRKHLKDILHEAKQSGKQGKELYIDILKGAFEADQAREKADQRQEWTGSGRQVVLWHYHKALGRWFNNPKEIIPLVKIMSTAGMLVFYGIIAAMIFMIFAARKNGGLFYWLLVVIPMALPVFFIIEYASWLWWYGHSLNDMGAFSLKPFMPTVFGQGKVAQFATHSYPDIGFGLMMLSSVLLALAALIRRKQLKDGGA